MKRTPSPNRCFARAPVALVRVDLRGAIGAANAAFAGLAGGKAAARRGMALGDVLATSEGGAVSPAALAAAEGRPFHAVLRRADGSTSRVEVRAAADGSGYLVALTEGSPVAPEPGPAAAAAGTSDDLPGLIASGLAHHLNNYLATVVTNAALLAPRIAELPPDNGDFLAEITEASSHAAAMIRQLLAFSRDVRAPRRPLALGPHLERLARRFGHELPPGIRMECDDRLAPPGEVRTDAPSIDRIVAGLVTNAREAMPRGGTIRITCGELVHERHDGAPTSEVPAGRYVVLTVSDTGVGMEADVQARLFEPFFTTKSAEGHLGLGLPVVFGLARRLGAYVTVESAPGAGTAVSVWLPADARATSRPATPKAGAPAPHAPARRASRTPTAPEHAPMGRHAILLVDDEVPLRVAAQKVLERLGYPVYSAGNGERGLRLFHAHEASVALVITDLMMPGLGGRGLYEALRAEGKQVPVVFTSGFVSAEMREREGLDPSVPFLEKPWEVPELVRVVRELAGPPPAPPS